ncbi:hypothetical protein OG401_23820 [Kitasatospora purpeofusca]|uniref:hypothetical protein n=1 Tax=Kitasatospora purpeofusca TaxID=67352 RepID=UPI002255739B|nr:hypothetical protein [Kitasatospora purpeofusca]MCX4687292.1 hypothetical protein [Kitasatospora purpeofusca]
MIPPHLLVYRVVVERPKAKADRYGGVTNDWSDPQRWDFPCWLEAQTADLIGQVSAGTWLLMIPGDVSLGMADRLTVDGTRYRLNRPPITKRTPAGVSHVEAELITFEGVPRD